MTDSVKFLGFRRDVREIIQCFDVQVFPGYREGTPNTLYEALAVGNAIVASRVDGQAEILENEKTALMFEAGDVDMLAKHILRVLQTPELMAGLRAAAKKRSQDFDGMRCIDTIQQLYERIVREWDLG